MGEIKTCICETIREEITDFIRVLNCVVKIVKAVIIKEKNPVGLNSMKEVTLRKAFRN